MKQPYTKAEYSNYVNKKSPNSPLGKNIAWAFTVGGIICMIGQFITNFFLNRGLPRDTVSAITSILLILFAIILPATFTSFCSNCS